MVNNQIFISYSRQNSDFVERLTNDLRAAGFNIWRDSDNLTAGTANWEKAIRTAIKEAAAVVYVASPPALASEYVQGELTVTRLYNCPIYTIWAEGDNWIECVPLVMVNHQYVDGRSDYTKGLNALVETLGRATDTSKGIITLGLPTHETIELNLALFDYALDILNYIYTGYLQHWYDPLHYGVDWILGNVETKRIAVSWDWLTVNRHSQEELWSFYAKAGALKVKDFGIEDGSHWAVWDARRIRVAGVALQDDELAKTILTMDSERELLQLSSSNKLVITPSDAISSIPIHNYRRNFVLAIFQINNDRCAFVQS